MPPCTDAAALLPSPSCGCSPMGGKAVWSRNVASGNYKSLNLPVSNPVNTTTEDGSNGSNENYVKKKDRQIRKVQVQKLLFLTLRHQIEYCSLIYSTIGQTILNWPLARWRAASAPPLERGVPLAVPSSSGEPSRLPPPRDATCNKQEIRDRHGIRKNMARVNMGTKVLRSYYVFTSKNATGIVDKRDFNLRNRDSHRTKKVLARVFWLDKILFSWSFKTPSIKRRKVSSKCNHSCKIANKMSPQNFTQVYTSLIYNIF